MWLHIYIWRYRFCSLGCSLHGFQQPANDSAGSTIKPQGCQNRAQQTHITEIWKDIASRETPPEADDRNCTGGRSAAESAGTNCRDTPYTVWAALFHVLKVFHRSLRKYEQLWCRAKQLVGIALRNLCLEWNKAFWQRNLIMAGSGGSRRGFNSGRLQEAAPTAIS